MIEVPQLHNRFRRQRTNKSKLLHKIYVYFPIFLLFFLIIMIYSTYFYKYIYVLIKGNIHADVSFPFINSLTKYDTRKKGILILSISGVSMILLFISLLRTILMDPGYFEDPTKLEMKIVMANSIVNKNNKLKLKSSRTMKKDEKQLLNENPPPTSESDDQNYKKKRWEFLKTFGMSLNNGPLTFYELSQYNRNFLEYIDERETAFPSTTKRNSDFRLSMATKKALGIPEIILYQEESDDILEIESNLKKKVKKDDPISPEFVFDNFRNIDISRSSLCNSCLRWKFERSHHCRQCGRCILKMDHHCPWLSNCIGFRNYKYFCLTHYYGTIGSFIISITFWEAIFNIKTFDESSLFLYSYLVFVYISNLSLMSFLLWLFNSNWKLIFNGMTIIEQSDRERFPSTKSVNIYDLGYYRNFKTVFGENPLFWFLPMCPNYKGLGIVFETNECDKRNQRGIIN